MKIPKTCPHCGNDELKIMEHPARFDTSMKVTLRCNHHFCRKTSYAYVPTEESSADGS